MGLALIRRRAIVERVEPPLVFSQTVEGLLKALSPMSATSKLKLQAIGVDPDRRLEPAYSREKWLELMRLACDIHAPGKQLEPTSYDLGRRFMTAYTQGLVGKAMMAALRVIGPRRALERMSRNFRTGNNFSETKLTEPSPGRYELWCSHATIAGWYQGIIEAGLALAGATEVKATLLRRENGGAVFQVEWK
jgi:uncharacterized protein (TIGR02265 family)